MTRRQIQHTKLQRAPLKRVICQLRFPTVLGFSDTTVRPFQRAIEDEYPTVEINKVIVGLAVSGSEQDPPQVDAKELFRFMNLRGDTVVVISADFLSLETTNYDRFPRFASQWQHLVSALGEAVGVKHQVRLGLRYTNVVEDENADTIDAWVGRIGEHLLQSARSMSSPFEATVFSEQHVLRAETEHGSIIFRHGFPAPPEEDLPSGYLVDIDSYDDEPKVIDIQRHLTQLDRWDHQSFALLHASVTDSLWASFQPEEVV